jgi:hypothetical protein
MTPTTTAAASSARAERRRLPAGVAFYLQASIVVAFLAGSSAPTPLYSVYQDTWGFSPITVTVIFGVYAVALLAALLTVGSLSDYVGRRPVLLVAIVLQALVMLGLANASGVLSLLVARIVQVSRSGPQLVRSVPDCLTSTRRRAPSPMRSRHLRELPQGRSVPACSSHTRQGAPTSSTSCCS